MGHTASTFRVKEYTQQLKKQATPQLKWLVAGFPPREPGFDPGSGQAEFVVDKVALG
jgi:hypothetical protein